MMKNLSKVRLGFCRPKVLSVLPAAIAAMVCLIGCNRELGVYTLCSYEDNWKGNVCVGASYDPYENFWNAMTAGSDAPYAEPGESMRYRNSEVTIKTVLPIAGDDLKGWDEFDLVFFYGHNNIIVPPDGIWVYVYNGSTWDKVYATDWGNTQSYDYYVTRPITSGVKYPGSVTYLYNKYTSGLIGGVYHYGQGSGMLWREHWDSPIQYAPYGTKAWQLGADDLEWLILHGCQAVIVASPDGSVYNPQGLKCYHWTQGGFHIVLGHYRSYYTSDLKPLSQFAADLMTGVPVQTAYFDVDPDNNSSAIAAETSPFSWANSTMANDRWTKQMPDYKDTPIFSQRWIRSVGTLAQQWN